MRRVKRSGTSAEEEVARRLRAAGIRYRRNVRTLPGSPDFANKSKGWAIFVNGCFWHHHKTCGRGTLPKRNSDFWREKFRSNRLRDARKIRDLRALGIKVHLIWECRCGAGSETLQETIRSLGQQTSPP